MLIQQLEDEANAVLVQRNVKSEQVRWAMNFLGAIRRLPIERENLVLGLSLDYLIGDETQLRLPIDMFATNDQTIALVSEGLTLGLYAQISMLVRLSIHRAIHDLHRTVLRRPIANTMTVCLEIDPSSYNSVIAGLSRYDQLISLVSSQCNRNNKLSSALHEYRMFFTKQAEL